MKKLITTLALMGAFGFVANAQRSADMEVLRYASSDTIIIDSISPVNFITQIGFVNHGPASLIATDSLRWATPYGNYYFVLADAIPSGDTVFFTPDTLQFTNGPATGMMPFCDSVWVTPVAGTVTDPTPAPTCMDVYIWNRNTPTSILNFANAKNINVYPNPTASQLNFAFDFEKSSNAAARVYDIAGRLVVSQDFGKQAAGVQNFTLDVTGLANGNYTLELTTDNNKGVSKFVIAK